MKKILLIEDNELDVKVFTNIVKNSEFKHSEIKVIKDGAEALDFVINTIEKNQTFWPDIVFLDHHLPFKNGDIVLRYIKSKHLLKTIPVIIISNSVHQKDISEAYHFHVNAYINKAMDLDVFEYRIIKSLDYWFRVVEPADQYVIKQASQFEDH